MASDRSNRGFAVLASVLAVLVVLMCGTLVTLRLVRAPATPFDERPGVGTEATRAAPTPDITTAGPTPTPTPATTTAETAAAGSAPVQVPLVDPTTDPTEDATTPANDAYYKNCAAAKAAGVAPLHLGEPGYRPGLDRDGDGVACE